MIEKRNRYMKEDTGQFVLLVFNWSKYQWLLFRDLGSCSLRWTRSPHISVIYLFKIPGRLWSVGSFDWSEQGVSSERKVSLRVWQILRVTQSLWNRTSLKARKWVIPVACFSVSLICDYIFRESYRWLWVSLWLLMCRLVIDIWRCQSFLGAHALHTDIWHFPHRWPSLV